MRFKSNRKEFFRNVNQLDLYQNDWVVVEAQHGHDVGQVTLKGELVRLQMKRRRVQEEDPAIRKIYRKATEQDLQKLTEMREQEAEVSYRAREVIKSIKLNMKLTDVEFQADRSKIIFYYTAEERVDFRELIRMLAEQFKTRVEMRQIGARQEAARIGGLGVCGRELCCSTWLTDFKSVSTSAARYQNLSLNPVKLAGQCGRLKCCLNYELETYMDALQAFPKDAKTLQTETATYELVKTDIFKRQMWYQIQGKPGEFVDMNAVPLSIEQAVEVRAMNKEGVKPATLEALVIESEVDAYVEPDFEVHNEDKLDRFDANRRSGNKKKKKPQGRGGDRNRNDGRGPGASSVSQAEGGAEKPAAAQQPRGERNDRNRNDRNRGPRPEGEARTDRGPRPERGPRAEGDTRPERAARPEGEVRPERGPRAEGERPNRGPRPERAARPEGEVRPDRGPRPERTPRPEGELPNRGPRPANEARPDSPAGKTEPQGEGSANRNNNRNRNRRRPPRGPRPDSAAPSVS
ncbi:MAG: regulatory iron-sulfur-containing complex subunit RicT [Sphingobacteriaceae bacterium]|nr:regulatory iron-sulfur-containing complex subunit RicT [Sphingobacteriaceae bacterium]